MYDLQCLIPFIFIYLLYKVLLFHFSSCCSSKTGQWQEIQEVTSFICGILSIIVSLLILYCSVFNKETDQVRRHDLKGICISFPKHPPFRPSDTRLCIPAHHGGPSRQAPTAIQLAKECTPWPGSRRIPIVFAAKTSAALAMKLSMPSKIRFQVGREGHQKEKNSPKHEEGFRTLRGLQNVRPRTAEHPRRRDEIF